MTTKLETKGERVEAVVFDLLSALLDSWTLWDSIAGSAGQGRKWRTSYLELTYGVGPYRPYEALVVEAAERVELPARWGQELVERWGELQAWPEVDEVLGALRGKVKLGVVTNCSEAMGRQAAALAGDFDVVVTAQRAGYYKPDPRTYGLALKELEVDASQALFVAGSPYDLIGCAQMGMRVYWHNRVGMNRTEMFPAPWIEAKSLATLPGSIGL
jgi:2-haloacid dehalogenase